jgi:hypothetical protein
MDRTKIVQGYNEEPVFLNDILSLLFSKIKANLSHIPIDNIIFRQIYNEITILLHIPKYNEVYLDDILKLQEIFRSTSEVISTYEVISLYIHPYKQLHVEYARVKVWGKYVNTFTFGDIKFNYTPTSFMQSNLECCKEMYEYIKQIYSNLKMNKIVKLYGYGEDTMNIANYLDTEAICLVHYQSTIDINYKQHIIGTLDSDYWKTQITTNNDVYNNISNNISNNIYKILITTPGRKGFNKGEIDLISNLDFDYIIYISCKKSSRDKDYDKLKYSILESKAYPSMFGNIDGYLECVEVWTRPTYISIGNDCSIANLINNKIYYPFDWCKSPSIHTIIDILDSNYALLLDKSKYIISENNTNKYSYIDDMNNKEIIDTRILKFVHKERYIYFPHDLRANNIEGDMIHFFEKMKRRIDRIKDNTIIRYETKPQQISDKIIEKLLLYCNEIIIITPYIHKLKITYNKVVKIIEDKYTDLHKSWKREGLYNINFV